MSLTKTNELTQIIDESMLPMEHSGGDGWSILHGDTLQIIRAFKPQVFDALITDPPYASGGWKASEKNRTTNQKYSSMDKDNWVTADLNETEGIYYVKDQAAEEATATTFIPVSTGALTVKGLEDDEYIITEIATDDGYTLLKDSITVVITSAESGVICDVCGKSGITATATVNGDAVGMIEDNGSVSAIVPMSVINTRGFDLPQTGENGTWLFAVGGVLIVSLSAAFIFFILAKKRKTDEQ